LKKRFPEHVGVFAARPAQDHDEAILFDEQLGFVAQAAQIADDFLGEAPSDVSAEQKELIERYRDCQRWQGILRDQESKKHPPAGPFYVASNWWEEGYSGSNPVYRAETAEIANELASAANTRFATDPHLAQDLGSCVQYDVVPADAVPSRIVWDEELQRLEEEVRAGKTDGNAEVHVACTKWEVILLAGKSDKVDSPRPDAVAAESEAEIGCAPVINIAPDTVVAAAETFVAAISNYATCVTKASDNRDPQQLYVPLERAGYILLRAARAWNGNVELLDRLLRLGRLEGIPSRDVGDRYITDEGRRQHDVAQYLLALKGEVYEIRHEAILRLQGNEDSTSRRTIEETRRAITTAQAGTDDLVTLDEAAAIVHRKKKTLERYLKKMPPPYVQGGGGKPSLWKWDDIRPWLEQQFVPDLPTRFPRNTR